MASRAVAPNDWRQLARRKLDEQIARAQVAREAIAHALHCPHEDILKCPNFGSVVAARLAGQPLHATVHEPERTCRIEAAAELNRATAETAGPRPASV